MSLGHLQSAKQFGKAVALLLLALQATNSLMNDPLMNVYSDDSINYTNFRSAAEARAAAEKRIADAKLASLTASDEEPVPNGDSVALEAREVEEEIAARGAASAVAPSLSVVEKMKVLGIEDHSEIKTSPLGNQVAALGSEALDEVRGGFEIPESNLKYSFGIERAVFINGELVAHTVLNLKDLQVSAGGGVPAQATGSAAAGALGVIQNGPGNNFTAQVGPNLAGTVIQNTLNNQKIQNVTTINASVNSAQVMRAMSVQSAVQSGIVSSLRR